MKANAKYTAEELLNEAGFDGDKLGKVRVRIGGIPVNKPDHVINIPAGSDKIDVLVGQDTKELSFDGDNDERQVSDGARASLDAEGAAIEATDEHKEAESDEDEDEDDEDEKAVKSDKSK